MILLSQRDMNIFFKMFLIPHYLGSVASKKYAEKHTQNEWLLVKCEKRIFIY